VFAPVPPRTACVCARPHAYPCAERYAARTLYARYHTGG
jgi:hypothetical protein